MDQHPPPTAAQPFIDMIGGPHHDVEADHAAAASSEDQPATSDAIATTVHRPRRHALPTKLGVLPGAVRERLRHRRPT